MYDNMPQCWLVLFPSHSSTGNTKKVIVWFSFVVEQTKTKQPTNKSCGLLLSRFCRSADVFIAVWLLFYQCTLFCVLIGAGPFQSVSSVSPVHNESSWSQLHKSLIATGSFFCSVIPDRFFCVEMLSSVWESWIKCVVRSFTNLKHL